MATVVDLPSRDGIVDTPARSEGLAPKTINLWSCLEEDSPANPCVKAILVSVSKALLLLKVKPSWLYYTWVRENNGMAPGIPGVAFEATFHA